MHRSVTRTSKKAYNDAYPNVAATVGETGAMQEPLPSCVLFAPLNRVDVSKLKMSDERKVPTVDRATEEGGKGGQGE